MTHMTYPHQSAFCIFTVESFSIRSNFPMTCTFSEDIWFHTRPIFSLSSAYQFSLQMQEYPHHHWKLIPVKFCMKTMRNLTRMN